MDKEGEKEMDKVLDKVVDKVVDISAYDMDLSPNFTCYYRSHDNLAECFMCDLRLSENSIQYPWYPVFFVQPKTLTQNSETDRRLPGEKSPPS